jgi:hypothetical protein
MFKEERDIIEGLIDKHGLDSVLGMIVNIMYEKAEHVQENWQDESGAKQLERYGKAVATAQHFVESH